MGIVLPIIIGLMLRLICIDKAEGLWNDEYISWMIANKPLLHGFAQGVASQCHMPFYYLYLKFFMTFFGQSDLLLRLTSVFAGLLSIFVMYLVGKEKDKRTAVLCATFTALSSFLIYYSQEVRLYSLLFLFSALALLASLKVIKEPGIKNILFSFLSNFFIIFTHTIGFVFVFFNLIFISVNLYKEHKGTIIKLWSTLAIAGVLLSPAVFKIFETQSFSQWWGNFSVSKIGFLITDYFSPVLTNLTNAPDNFFYSFTWGFLIFGLIPSVIALIWLFKALTNKINIGLFAIAFMTVLTLIIASISGRLVFITKYSIEIYPILILLISIGAMSFKKTYINYILIGIYCVLQLIYIPLSPVSAPKIKRSEGHKIIAGMLERAELKDGDIILLEYYPPDRFDKYFDFSKYRVASINKGNFAEYLSPDTTYLDAYKNGKELYKPIFETNKDNYFDNKIKNDIINQLEPNQSAAIVMLNSVAFYSPEQIREISSDDTLYKSVPLLFLTFSYIKNATFKELAQNLPVTRFEQKGSWSVIKFTNLNNDKKNSNF